MQRLAYVSATNLVVAVNI